MAGADKRNNTIECAKPANDKNDQMQRSRGHVHQNVGESSDFPRRSGERGDVGIQP